MYGLYARAVSNQEWVIVACVLLSYIYLFIRIRNVEQKNISKVYNCIYVVVNSGQKYGTEKYRKLL